MTRVLMLSCQYMPDVFGGAEKQCQRVATELAARGHRVCILTSTQRSGQAGTRNEQGVQVHRIRTWVAPDLLGRWMADSVWWLAAVLIWGRRRRGEFDLLHCHQGKFGAFVAVCLGRLMGLPVLIKIGNSEDDMDLRCLQRKALVGAPMVRHVLARRPTFVAISAVIRANLNAFGCRDVVAIPNGISSRQMPAEVARADRPAAEDGGPQFFYHGRIEPIKRVDVLLQAFALLAADCPGAGLHILGEGGALAACRAQARAAGLGQRVHFHGLVADAIAAVQPYDVFVNASRSEGFSNALLEALLLGKVLVSTPVSGAAEAIVPGVNGELAADFSAPALAEAMRRALALLGPDERRAAAAASDRLVTRHFAMPAVVDQYERLYHSLAIGGAT